VSCRGDPRLKVLRKSTMTVLAAIVSYVLCFDYHVICCLSLQATVSLNKTWCTHSMPGCFQSFVKTIWSRGYPLIQYIASCFVQVLSGASMQGRKL
jgi:hypothetical protein